MGSSSTVEHLTINQTKSSSPRTRRSLSGVLAPVWTYTMRWFDSTLPSQVSDYQVYLTSSSIGRASESKSESTVQIRHPQGSPVDHSVRNLHLCSHSRISLTVRHLSQSTSKTSSRPTPRPGQPGHTEGLTRSRWFDSIIRDQILDH